MESIRICGYTPTPQAIREARHGGHSLTWEWFANCLPSVKKAFGGNILPFHSSVLHLSLSTSAPTLGLCVSLRRPVWVKGSQPPHPRKQQLHKCAPNCLLITVKDLLLPQQGICIAVHPLPCLSQAGQHKEAPLAEENREKAQQKVRQCSEEECEDCVSSCIQEHSKGSNHLA